jgi:hypothetical protein
MTMKASAWRPHLSGSLQGFFNLRLPSGLCLNDLTLHQQGDKRWVGLPGKPQLDAEGRQRIGDGGKKLYTPVVEIADRQTRDRFTTQVLAAVDRMLGR